MNLIKHSTVLIYANNYNCVVGFTSHQIRQDETARQTLCRSPVAVTSITDPQTDCTSDAKVRRAVRTPQSPSMNGLAEA